MAGASASWFDHGWLSLYTRGGFAVLFAAYLWCWSPGIVAYARLRSMGKSNDDMATPPTFVIYAIMLIFGLFLLFPAVYLYFLVRGPSSLSGGIKATADRESAYLFASMVAKVSLHAVVGFSVVGQSAALDSARTRGNRTRLIGAGARDDDETIGRIFGTSGGAFVLLLLIVVLLRRYPRGKDELGKLKRLNLFAFFVHVGSAFGILGAALHDDGTLARYGVKPDLSPRSFYDPQAWELRCFNATLKALGPVRASCPGSLEPVYSNAHRGEGGFLNIAVCAFVFAFWSGLWHGITYKRFDQRSVALFSGPKRASNATVDLNLAVFLARCRWYDYLVSAPIMLLTVNILFAASNGSGVIVAPLLLLGLEFLAMKAEVAYYYAPSSRSINPRGGGESREMGSTAGALTKSLL